MHAGELAGVRQACESAQGGELQERSPAGARVFGIRALRAAMCARWLPVVAVQVYEAQGQVLGTVVERPPTWMLDGDDLRGGEGGAARGEIHEFTKPTAARLREALCRYGEPLSRGDHIVLTAPYDLGADGWHAAREWLRWWFRDHGLAGIWLREHTKRGWPHGHIVAVGMTDTLRRELVRAWADRLARNRLEQVRMIRHAVAVRRVGGFEGLAGYLAKDLSKNAQKAPQGPQGAKWWGIWNRRWLEKASPAPATVPDVTLEEVVAAQADTEMELETAGEDLGIGHIGGETAASAAPGWAPRVYFGDRARWFLWNLGVLATPLRPP